MILSGDIHAFIVNDVNARPEDPESPIVATELVTTSISSVGRAAIVVRSLARRRTRTCDSRAATARGYLRVTLEAEHLRADLVAVDDIEREDSPTHVLASFDVESGQPGVAR